MANTLFYGIATKEGGIDFGSAHNLARYRHFLKENAGTRIKIEPLTPESNKQRRFFEGAVIPLVAYYQENLDHHNGDDLAKARDWLKIEFNGEFVVLKGKSVKVPASTKGKLQQGLLERIIDWIGDQGGDTTVLVPNEYKHWRDTIFPHGGPDNYIDYLVEIGRLKPI